MDLAAAELELSSEENYLLKLRQSLQSLKSNPQLQAILIDCPPTLGLLSMNSLCAADHLIVTLQSEYLALEGLSQIVEVIEKLKGSMVNPTLSLGGILMTMYDNRTKLSYEVWEEVNQHYQNLVFRTVIPRTVRLASVKFWPNHFRIRFQWAWFSFLLLLRQKVIQRFFFRIK